MGCFISTSSAAPPHIYSSAQHHGGSKSPPPVDEETVKEVLAETPAVDPRPTPPVSSSHGSERMQLHQNGGDARKSAASFSNDDPSDVDYEMHSSFSEGFSTGNDGTLRWRPMLSGRSLPGELKKGKTAPGRSRSGASPDRFKPGSGYSCKASGRDRSRSGSGSSETGLAAGKSQRKMGNYSGRIGYGSGARIRTGEVEKEREREEPPTKNELLESSLVSLECFIFL